MKVNEAVWVPLESEKPIVVQQGGTSSGKTYGILQWLFKCGIERPEIITVFSEDIPGLRAGAYRDAKTILQDNDWLRKYYPEHLHNKSDRIYKSTTGAEIEFKSFSDEIDARQGKRHRSFCNEANGVPYEVWEQVNLRTSIQSIIDFNPSARFWAHEHLEGRDDVEWVVTTYRDNTFLDSRIKDKILSYEPTPENIKRGTANQYRWQVYGLGQVGRLEGLVFPNFKTTTDFPDEYKWRVFGMDFGFTNDPTTLIEIRYAHGNLYWNEHIYKTGMTNPDIAKELERIGHDRSELIIADSAEPKSIEELTRLRWRVKPAEKGKDSVMHGIDALNRYNLFIHAKSHNLIEEFSSYTWQKDRDGNPMNKPIDKFNHGIDAGRYAVGRHILKPHKQLQWT
jgi:phage terminase large subunit